MRLAGSSRRVALVQGWGSLLGHAVPCGPLLPIRARESTLTPEYTDELEEQRRPRGTLSPLKSAGPSWRSSRAPPGQGCSGREQIASHITPSITSCQDTSHPCPDTSHPYWRRRMRTANLPFCLAVVKPSPARHLKGFVQQVTGMKHPISPDHIFGDGIMTPSAFLRGFEDKGLRHDRPDYQLSKEKKKILFSFCDVCNIQLNSAAQAQVHYSGKSHLKIVKQLNNGKLPTNTSTGTLFAGASTGGTCHTTTLPNLVRTPTLMMQPSLDIKPFVSFPVDGSSAVGLFPNFNTMDPVQKAVINHTFGVSIPPKKKQVISCNVCQLRFNSDSQAEAHYKGNKHAKKVKALEATKNRPKAGTSKDSTKANTNCSATPIPASISDKSDKADLKANGSSQFPNAEVVSFISESGTTAALTATAATPSSSTSSKSTNGTTNAISESEEEKAKKLLYCSLCKVAVNSLSQLEAHNTGSKHKTMVEARNGAGPIKSYPRPGSRLKTQSVTMGSGLQNKTFHCEICDVHVNSEIQLKQHISSRRHKDKIAGKPTKPKYSPYNKLQRGPSILAAKLAFQKDMIKPLAPTFLSSPLAAAAAAAVSATLTLPPRPSAALFQAPTIPTALLRAGHGPIRATPTSILFAPY
ncbi:zinc finger protein 385B isoform X2 [Rhineura floridana]|uniref:zinc finger protein 385B isoform X2 n=1 Tax=Rhineura floridana TaxID=261503 RepID=UPI002AC872D8|nr:zinc finger protein 385B isoform X2 [Rhineura floridana]